MRAILLSLIFVTAVGVEAQTSPSIQDFCVSQSMKFPGRRDSEGIKNLCAAVSQKEGCSSVNGKPIYHFEKQSEKKTNKKILVLGVIHGDESPSGTLVNWWMHRLSTIDHSNTWRFLPLTNPDGFERRTRTNANNVDINRNFPTRDWGDLALNFWKEKTRSNPRRFPGDSPGSEPETKCITSHIEEFQPDFIIAVHTPYAVLDFDGPKVNFPKFMHLPWDSLGNFPGSLGRYMWVDRRTPVLTIELKGSLPDNPNYLLDLQDISGQVAKLSAGAKTRVINSN